MAMEGFDPKFKDFPDYIIKITREIWEGRGVAALHDYYDENLVFRLASGVGVGNRDVINATLATLAEFPDRQLLAEDVIWSGSPEAGMLSSHRLWCSATHTGHGQFGAPTGKRVTFRAIADCHAKNNKIDDEWLTRDQGAICRQMGTTPRDFAADLITREGGPEKASRPFTPGQDRKGPYQGRGNDDEWGQRYADILNSIMRADVAVVQREYDRAVRLAYPGGIEARSWGPAEEFWIGLRASFPDAEFTIDHQIGRDDPMLGARAAIRFSLHGKHDGWGSWGAPTGAKVYIMGMAHADFGPWGLRAETVVFDESAAWKQILLQTG